MKIDWDKAGRWYVYGAYIIGGVSFVVIMILWLYSATIER